jgi:glycosyltransferase involved in cell wall biosynthesis
MGQRRNKRGKKSARKQGHVQKESTPTTYRIGIDITAAVSQGGGIGRYTRELVQALTRAGRKDAPFHYHLFSARRPTPPPTRDTLPEGSNVSYREAQLSAKWLYRLWYLLRVPLPVQRFTGEIDLFHSPDFVLPPVRGSIPTLVTVHDLSFAHYPETFTPALLRFLNGAVPRSVQRATHVLADSEATCADLIEIWNTPPEKISVLYSGVHSRFHPIADEAKLARVQQKYGLAGKPYLLSVGTVQPRKNYRMLIRAFSSLADQWPHNLAIAGGNGWLFDETLAEAERHGIGARVHFLGFVDDEDLPALYSGATIFLFPSLYEGFGLPPLEAMACGAPVMVSDASCLPEVVGSAAIQLPASDEEAWRAALAELLRDNIRRSHMVAAGFIRAREFTWEKAAKQLRRIYQELLVGQDR